MTEYQVRPLEEPARATSLVADLLADPSISTADSILALRRTLHEAAQAADPTALTAASLAERVAANCRAPVAVIGSTASSVLSALEIAEPEGFVTQVRTREQIAPPVAPKRDRRYLKVAAVALTAAALAAVIIVVGLNVISSTTEPNDTAANDTTTPTTDVADDVDQLVNDADGVDEVDPTADETPTDSEPEPTAIPTGFTVSFAEAEEGVFIVDRGWRIVPSQDELIGIVRLTAPANAPASGLHAEVVPPLPGATITSITWSPEPATVINRVARFNVTVNPGEAFEIEFRSPITPDNDLTEADLSALVDPWSEEMRQQRPLGESDQVFQPLIEPTDE